MIIDAKKAEAVEQDQKWIDGEKFDTIIISKAQFQQFKENANRIYRRSRNYSNRFF